MVLKEDKGMAWEVSGHDHEQGQSDILFCMLIQRLKIKI